MARSRNIKPGFFRNEELVELPYETRLLFIGLWTVADRRGRLEDRPKRIKMELFPADDLNVDACLQQLHDSGFIIRYTSDDHNYIQVVAFRKHQNPHHKEQASTIPPPDGYDDGPEDDQGESGASPVQAPDKPGASRADSLNTDSLNTDSLSTAPKARAQNRFESFWSAYPKKRSKGAAERAWAKINPSQELTDTIIKSIEAHKKSPDWLKEDGQFIPYPATWLNAKGWEDEVTRGSLTVLPNGQPSPFAGRGYDPYRSMTPEENERYQKQLAAAKAEAAEWERRGA